MKETNNNEVKCRLVDTSTNCERGNTIVMSISEILEKNYAYALNQSSLRYKIK